MQLSSEHLEELEGLFLEGFADIIADNELDLIELKGVALWHLFRTYYTQEELESYRYKILDSESFDEVWSMCKKFQDAYIPCIYHKLKGIGKTSADIEELLHYKK